MTTTPTPAGFYVISRSGARYSTTGTPEGAVLFRERADAAAVRDEYAEDCPSSDLPLRVVPADSDLVAW